MKPLLFLLLILPAGLNAQQTSVSAPKTQAPVGTNNIASGIDNISALSSKIDDISATIKSLTAQIKSLQSSRTKTKDEIDVIKKQINEIGNDESRKVQKAELEKKIAELTNQLNQIDKQISDMQILLDKQTAELKKLEDLIDEQRKKMEEIAVRDRQQTESKQTDETKKTTTTVEEKALAYAHVKIIIDSLPSIASRLSFAERNLVSSYNSRFNSDAQFRFTTMAYIKHSKANNYFGVISKAGPSTDLINRLLIATREELVILSRN